MARSKAMTWLACEKTFKQTEYFVQCMVCRLRFHETCVGHKWWNLNFLNTQQKVMWTAYWGSSSCTAHAQQMNEGNRVQARGGETNLQIEKRRYKGGWEKPWPNLEWPNLERPNLERLNVEGPNLERPNIEKDLTSKDRTSNGTERRKTERRMGPNVERLNVERPNFEWDLTSKDWT